MKQKYFIDTHKALTGLAVLAMMAFYDQWHNPTAWVYLALHGTYGFLWLLKSRIFPDKQWETTCTLSAGLGITAFLTLYWIAPWLLTSQNVQAPPWYLAMCISMYSFGVFFHFTADMQKYISLKLKPGALITDGMMQRCRNTNYFGELLIYLGFGLLAMHWLPIAIIGFAIATLWMPNMLRKDRSLARYPEFQAYAQRTHLFIPFLF